MSWFGPEFTLATLFLETAHVRFQKVRGGIEIENRENLGQCPNGGGLKESRNVPISIWEF